MVYAQASVETCRSHLPGSAPLRSPGPSRARTLAADARARRRLERDLHDGVQSELLALVIQLALAIQNVVKNAGDAARVVLYLLHHDGSLVIRICHDGHGFDPDQATEGAGLQNIRDRVEDLGGSFELASKPGAGTVLPVAVPWPPSPDPDR